MMPDEFFLLLLTPLLMFDRIIKMVMIPFPALLAIPPLDEELHLHYP